MDNGNASTITTIEAMSPHRSRLGQGMGDIQNAEQKR